MPPELIRGAAQRFWALVLMEHESLQAAQPADLVHRLNALLEPALPGVAVEMDGAPPAGPAGRGARLVFTAHGEIRQFAAVQALVDAAPQGIAWPVQAFRQRTAGGFGLRLEGFALGSDELLVRVGSLDGRVALALSFARPVPPDLQAQARQMAFILLDHLLGEFDFSVKVGVVEFDADGLSDDAGFERCPATPLDEAVALVDACWRDRLGRSAHYPAEPHRWAALEGAAADGVPILVQVNRSANAVAGRADLGWRIEARLPITGKQDVEAAQAFEEAWLAAACLHQQGLCSHVVLRSGWRGVHCYVSDVAAAMQAAHAAARALPAPEALQLQAVHEPDWSDYLSWYVECAD